MAANASEVGDFLITNELTESKAFIRSFVNEIVVCPGSGEHSLCDTYAPDSILRGGDAAEVALREPVLSTVPLGWGWRIRTPAN